MRTIQGDLITDHGAHPAYLDIDDATVTLHHGTAPGHHPTQGYILTGIINAHTHLGDAFIRHRGLTLPPDVKALVAPPDGLKHRLLHTTPSVEITVGMKRTLTTMLSYGTMAFCDFREGGLPGINQLLAATEESPVKPLILSRPQTLTYDNHEVTTLLRHSHGIGISSITDWPGHDLDDLAAHTHKSGKLFALHASETTRENIDRVLSLEPDFLVHCTTATPADLKKIADAHIPVVLCPRSYQFFGIHADYQAFKDSGIHLMLGSDNAMLQPPNVLDDVKALRATNIFTIESLLEMVSVTPSKELRITDRIQGLNPMEHLVVLRKQSLTPLFISPSQTPGVEQL